MNRGWKYAVACYSAAALIVILGAAEAARHFPEGFDWVYTVISRLGSRRHNPDGAVWLSGALLAATLLLWPVVRHLGRASGSGASSGASLPRRSLVALRVGVIGAALLAIEGLFALDLSRVARKGHEILALGTFLGMYLGVLGLYLQRIREGTFFLLPALLVIFPLCAVGLSQLSLYLGQAELGWVNSGWRELGVPFWLSFAFWQWLAVALLGAGLGFLLIPGREARSNIA